MSVVVLGAPGPVFVDPSQGTPGAPSPTSGVMSIQGISGAYPVSAVVGVTGPVAVTGSIGVNNFPAIQGITGAVGVIGPIGITGSVSVNQGSPAALANKWPVIHTDGTNTQPTMDVAARKAFVAITDGTNTAAVKGSSGAALATDPSLVVAPSPNSVGPVQITTPTGLAQGIFGTNFAAGFQRVSDEPRQIFHDPFDGTLLDQINWAAATSSGGGVAPAITAGSLTLGTGTTGSGYSYLKSNTTFRSPSPGWLGLSHVLKFEASPIANTYRFWGLGTIPTTPASSSSTVAGASLTDGVGWELTTDGKLLAVVWINGSRTIVQDLSASGNNKQPTDGAFHRYNVYVRTDKVYWYIDSQDVPVATASFIAPQVQTLPDLFLAVAASSAPVSSGVIICSGVTNADTAKNTTQIVDSIYPSRRAAVDHHNRLQVANGLIPIFSEDWATDATSYINPNRWFPFTAGSFTVPAIQTTGAMRLQISGASGRYCLVSQGSYYPKGGLGGGALVLDVLVDTSGMGSGGVIRIGWNDNRGVFAGLNSLYLELGVLNLRASTAAFIYNGTAKSASISYPTGSSPSAGIHRVVAYWYSDKAVFFVDNLDVPFSVLDLSGISNPTPMGASIEIKGASGNVGVTEFADFYWANLSTTSMPMEVSRAGAEVTEDIGDLAASGQSFSVRSENCNGQVSTAATTATYIRNSTWASFAPGSFSTITFVSSSASDASAGVGAQMLAVSWIDQIGCRRFTNITMNGTSVVTFTCPTGTFATCVEQMYIIQAGSTQVAVGTITAKINAIAAAVMNVGDSRTLYAHRFLPSNRSMLIRGIRVAATGVAGAIRLIALPLGTGAAATMLNPSGAVPQVFLTGKLRVALAGTSQYIKFDPPIAIGGSMTGGQFYLSSSTSQVALVVAQWICDSSTAAVAYCEIDAMEIDQ